MIHEIKIGKLNCQYSEIKTTEKIAYILYPMNILSDWIEPASVKYDVTIVVVTGMDWQNVFSPWEAKGVPAGSANFKGEGARFLKVLEEKVIPTVETTLGIG